MYGIEIIPPRINLMTCINPLTNFLSINLYYTIFFSNIAIVKGNFKNFNSSNIKR